jgi:hypothetical protein
MFFIQFQSSLDNGGGGIVTLAPPNDEIVYQCENYQIKGIQKVRSNPKKSLTSDLGMS